MKIINKDRGTSLAEDAAIAKTPLRRMVGLLNRRELKQGQALIIKPCNSIHTFFMQFAIDVIFVDSNNRITREIRSMRPFRISGIYLNALFSIELPAGTLERTSTQTGDHITLID
ncbi:MAG: DUF192 domain-containing protein [Candidatus Omnitrophica bacterium]|nr:DUF192 domain-containing protein [Candidatus Omnitrophota bacterium]